MSLISEKREIISKLNRLDLSSADYEMILSLIGDLIAGIESVRACEILAGQKLYRARTMSHQPDLSKEIFSPPDNFVNDYQRCNPPQRAIFYSAFDEGTAMSEIGGNVGDTVYVSEWQVETPFMAALIHSRTDTHSPDPCSDMVSTFFETLFLQPIHKKFSTQYKLTSAICQVLTGTIYEKSSEVNATAVASLLYPSISCGKRADCLAIRPLLAERFLLAKSVEERVILNIVDDKIRYDIKRYTEGVGDDKILWPEGERKAYFKSKESQKEWITKRGFAHEEKPVMSTDETVNGK